MPGAQALSFHTGTLFLSTKSGEALDHLYEPVLHLNFRSLVFKLFVAVLVAALFVFGGLHFDLVFGLTHAF